MEAISAIIINKALDGLTLRSLATAQNVASAGSPNFQPVEVKFEERLKAAAAQGGGAVRDLTLAMTRAPSSGFENEPRLDLELATAAETAQLYGALLDMLGREMAIARSAIRGGQ